jgi:hypothetical protein
MIRCSGYQNVYSLRGYTSYMIDTSRHCCLLWAFMPVCIYSSIHSFMLGPQYRRSLMERSMQHPLPINSTLNSSSAPIMMCFDFFWGLQLICMVQTSSGVGYSWSRRCFPDKHTVFDSLTFSRSTVHSWTQSNMISLQSVAKSLPIKHTVWWDTNVMTVYTYRWWRRKCRTCGNGDTRHPCQ